MLNGKEERAGMSAEPLTPAMTKQAMPNGSTPPKVIFQKAVKYNAKGRVALIGPAGGGKSLTALTLARALAGPTGKIAAIDTEHGSLSKYADLFDFDVLELDSFSPGNFIDALHAAEEAGYAVFLCDSLSHFWTGKDGAFDFVDMAAKRHRDNMGGWKEFRPHERSMVDELIASPCHVICTMRTKTDYQDQVNEKTGKKTRVKIGLAPVQRDGLEYEFDLVGYMDEDNTFAVDKTRCPAYSQKAYTKPDAKTFAPFVDWLKGAARIAVATPKPPVTETAIPLITPNGRPEPGSTWGVWRKAFRKLEAQLGSVAFAEEMERFSLKSVDDLARKGGIHITEFYDWLAVMVRNQQGVA